MPTLIDMRRKIRSVNNTQQMTKAMKTVSGAKLRKTQAKMLSARPYAYLLAKTIKSILSKVEKREHPLLEVREEHNVDVIVITADKGLCGAFNSRIIGKAEDFVNSLENKNVNLILIGKKGRDYFGKRNYPIRKAWTDILFKFSYEKSLEISEFVLDLYEKKITDSIYLVYNEFKSIARHDVVVEKLFPFEPLEEIEGYSGFIFEFPPEDIFSHLLPMYVKFSIYHKILESAVSEHAERMIAMDNATRNAEELIASLTLQMNKIRQASITKEIIEITTAAEALARMRE
ncbi:MAG: ATP synthase F1 subunit gamma [Candidatus Aminicenantia bacterium]